MVIYVKIAMKWHGISSLLYMRYEECLIERRMQVSLYFE